MSDVKENGASADEAGKNPRKSWFLAFCTVALIVAFFIFLLAGFYKLADGSAYVGGDAYNYMINAGKATALFVIAFGSLISAILLGILGELGRLTP